MTDELDRRTMLRRAATASAGLAAVGSATAARPAPAGSATADVAPARVQETLAAAGVTTDAFDASDLESRPLGALVAGRDGVARLTRGDGELIVTRRRVDDGVLRTFHEPATDTAHAVLDRGETRFVIDDGVHEITAAGTCENECQRNDCGFGEERVEFVYEEDSGGDCVVTTYDCGCS